MNLWTQAVAARQEEWAVVALVVVVELDWGAGGGASRLGEGVWPGIVMTTVCDIHSHAYIAPVTQTL